MLQTVFDLLRQNIARRGVKSELHALVHALGSHLGVDRVLEAATRKGRLNDAQLADLRSALGVM